MLRGTPDTCHVLHREWFLHFILETFIALEAFVGRFHSNGKQSNGQLACQSPLKSYPPGDSDDDHHDNDEHDQ